MYGVYGDRRGAKQRVGQRRRAAVGSGAWVCGCPLHKSQAVQINIYFINIYHDALVRHGMHALVVLIAGGLRMLETQHVNRRTEGVLALARLSGVTAGREALAGPDARPGMRTSRWYSAVMRQPSRRMYISNSSTAASPVPCRAHSRTSYLSGSSRELRSSEGEAQPRAAAGDMGHGGEGFGRLA